jgi:hypothetical protein
VDIKSAHDIKITNNTAVDESRRTLLREAVDLLITRRQNDLLTAVNNSEYHLGRDGDIVDWALQRCDNIARLSDALRRAKEVAKTLDRDGGITVEYAEALEPHVFPRTKPRIYASATSFSQHIFIAVGTDGRPRFTYSSASHRGFYDLFAHVAGGDNESLHKDAWTILRALADISGPADDMWAALKESEL